MALPFNGITLFPQTTITVAATTAGLASPIRDVKHLEVQATFNYGSDGTTVKVFIQTSLDEGATWIDIMTLAFTTTAAKKVSVAHRDTPLAAAIVPTDGTLADDVVVNGLIGDRVRAKVITTGTYAGVTNIAVKAVVHR